MGPGREVIGERGRFQEPYTVEHFGRCKWRSEKVQKMKSKKNKRPGREECYMFSKLMNIEQYGVSRVVYCVDRVDIGV